MSGPLGQPSLGIQLRRMRRDRGLTLQQLASTVSVSHAHLSRIERDEKRPSPDLLVRIAEALSGDPRPLLAASVGLESSEELVTAVSTGRPSPSDTDGLRAVAAMLHPEL